MTELRAPRGVYIPQHVYIKVFVYGDPGSGKTWFADSANNDKRSAPVLHIECSGNPMVVARKPNRHIISIKTLKDLNGWFNWLRTGRSDKSIQPVLEYWQKAEGSIPTFKTVVVDQLTDLQMQQMTANLDDVNFDLSKEPVKPTFQNYGVLLEQMIKFARLFYALPMHVVLTSWEKTREEGDPARVVSYRPSLVGKSAHMVPGFAEIVMRLVTVGSLGKLQLKRLGFASTIEGYTVGTFQGDKALIRDLWGVFGKAIVDPTFTKLLNAIEKGGVRETKKPVRKVKT